MADSRPVTNSALPPEGVAPALLAWAEQHGRHDLPWQHDQTPYRVWVSEVMLQQTQVATVLPYYARFLARFPDVETLAAAPLDEVLSLWTGLGYYARARNLHRAARLVVESHGGRIPTDVDLLKRLPGIGRSTAGAILAILGSQRHPILDGNARRVLARTFGVGGDPSAPETLRRLWMLAEACTPHEQVAEYTQAIMDLGAGVCVRGRPRCASCPLSTGCVAYQTGRQQLLPSPRRNRARPQRTAYALVALRCDGAILLERRPARGLWGGLYSFPMFDSESDARLWYAENLAPSRVEPRVLPPQRHAFTHYDLTLQPVVVHIDGRHPPMLPLYDWFDPRKPPAIGLSKAVTDLLPNLPSRFM